VHDRHFKTLLDRFFGDFIQIALPEMAPLLRLEQARFVDKELFTDPPGGEHGFLDLLAEVDTTEGDTEILLVHVEIEAEARGDQMDHRMWRYAMQLWLRDRRPVLPIVLYLRGGEADVVETTVEHRFARWQLASFTYWAFGLSPSDAASYLDRPEALAPALAALMDRGERSAAEHKFECLRRISRFEIDDAGRYLLVNTVETYIDLDDEAREEFARLLSQEPSQEVRIMELTWGEQIEARGIEKGRLEGMRAVLLGQLERRFGPLAPATRERIQEITDGDELSGLADRLLDARSVEELGL
jgi:hypothetical protein